ncbi:hypothetical protein Plhal304r1_c038g0114421 [Plasmopara halstedii]
MRFPYLTHKRWVSHSMRSTTSAPQERDIVLGAQALRAPRTMHLSHVEKKRGGSSSCGETTSH